MVAEAPLNAEAPEFHPNSTQLHNKKLQSISWPTTPFPFSMISFQHHRYFFVSSYRQPPFLYYKYPTFTPALPHHQQFLAPEPEVPTTHPHTMAHEPTGLEAQQQKEAVEAVEKASGGSSTKGVVAVPKAINLMEGTTRRSGGTSNLKAYAWRRKDSKEKNQARAAVMSEQYFRAFPQKKQVRPVVPMRRDGDETTVMIRNIPSKYTYVTTCSSSPQCPFNTPILYIPSFSFNFYGFSISTFETASFSHLSHLLTISTSTIISIILIY